MSDGITTYRGRIFDGERLQDHAAARFRGDVFEALLPAEGAEGDVVDLGDDILSPGYVDLQVNGGDGLMFNDDPSVDTLRRMAAAHRRLGATTILPTLITDTPAKTEAAIAASRAAIAAGVPGIAGLHLEGPHLSVARKGAHDPRLIRPMSDDDLAALLDAARHLSVLKVTIAPENVTLRQVETLADAGVLLSLGHSDTDFDTANAYAAAGVRLVTHLFNAMSPLASRAPGLVGAALRNGGLSSGLIADGIHVHPAAMALAWAANVEPGRIFLVSDAMAVAGTDAAEFHLEGRRISRRDGRLTLDDGTLAGADLDLTTALRVLTTSAGVPLEAALGAATTVPAQLIGHAAGLVPGETRRASLIRISSDLTRATPLVEAA